MNIPAMLEQLRREQQIVGNVIAYLEALELVRTGRSKVGRPRKLPEPGGLTLCDCGKPAGHRGRCPKQRQVTAGGASS